MRKNLKNVIYKRLLSIAVKENKIETAEDLESYIVTKREKILKEILGTRKISEIKSGSRAGQFYFHAERAKTITKKTREEVEDALIAEYLRLTDSKVSSFFDKVLERHQDRVSGNTISDYKLIYRKYFDELSVVSISKLTEKRLIEWLEKSAVKCGKKKEFEKVKTLTRKILTQAHLEDYEVPDLDRCLKLMAIGRNTLQPPRKKHETEMALTSESASLLLSECLTRPSVSRLALALALTTGLRLGELTPLMYADLHRDFISVSHTEEYDKESRKWVDLPYAKTSASLRDVYLSDDAKKVLEAIKNFNKKSYPTAKTFLFPSKTFKHIRGNSLREAMYDLDRVLDFEYRYSPHDLRRTYATIAHIKGGMPVKLLQRQLGHESAQQTYQYIHSALDTADTMKYVNGVSLL